MHDKRSQNPSIAQLRDQMTFAQEIETTRPFAFAFVQEISLDPVPLLET